MLQNSESERHSLQPSNSTENKGVFSSLSPNSHIWFQVSCLLLAAVLFTIVLTFQNYGITYDEFWRSTYGNLIIQWYKTGFQNKEALTYWNLYYYGGFFDVVQQLASKISPLGIYETRHLINALFGMASLIGVYKIGKTLASPFVGFLSILILLFTPRFYGHAFNNPIDIPSATLYIFSLYFLIVLIIDYPKSSIKNLLLLGITLGLELGVRINFVIIGFYIAIAFGLLLTRQFIFKDSKGLDTQNIRANIRKFSAWFLLIMGLAYCTMLIWWPAGQVDPIRQPVRSIKYFSSFDYSFNVFFDGRLILNTQLPWYYQIKWLLITMPEFMILALSIGVVLLIINNSRLSKIRQNLGKPQNIGLIILILSIAMPLGYTMISQPTDYDGIRHFLFVIPPLAIIAALSLGKLLESSSKLLRTITLTITIAFITLTGVDMVRLHPDEYIYFNRLFGGGIAKASQKYDTDYWGNSYKEAVEWLEKYYPISAGSPKLKVASCLQSLSTSYYLRDNRFEYIGTYHDGQKISGTPDIFLSSTRWNCDSKSKW